MAQWNEKPANRLQAYFKEEVKARVDSNLTFMQGHLGTSDKPSAAFTNMHQVFADLPAVENNRHLSGEFYGALKRILRAAELYQNPHVANDQTFLLESFEQEWPHIEHAQRLLGDAYDLENTPNPNSPEQKAVDTLEELARGMHTIIRLIRGPERLPDNAASLEVAVHKEAHNRVRHLLTGKKPDPVLDKVLESVASLFVNHNGKWPETLRKAVDVLEKNHSGILFRKGVASELAHALEEMHFAAEVGKYNPHAALTALNPDPAYTRMNPVKIIAAVAEDMERVQRLDGGTKERVVADLGAQAFRDAGYAAKALNTILKKMVTELQRVDRQRGDEGPAR